MRKILMAISCLLCLNMLFGQNYHIGDIYTAPDGSRGIVFYLHPDGSGGWVVALTDVSSGCAWGATIDIPQLQNQNPSYPLDLMNDTTGYSSTQIIRSYQNNNANYAAGKVDFLRGWYLPTPGQLYLMYGMMPIIESALASAGGSVLVAEGRYWTCAEQFSNMSWTMVTPGGYLYQYNKSSMARVRAVRSFSHSTEPEFSYLWSTGDTTAGITVTPTQTTTYTVVVSTLGGGADTVGHTIVVNHAEHQAYNVFECGTYTWTDGDGQTYSSSGDYLYSHEDGDGCMQVDTLHLTISHSPDVTVTVNNDTICVGEVVTLQAETASEIEPSVPIYPIPTVVVGDILCTDNSIVKPSNWPMAGKTAKGIVFYVDNTGEHGWAVHLHDQSTSVTWGEYGTDIPTLTNYANSRAALTDFNGYINTQRARAAGTSTMYPAVYLADFDNGWYVPAAGQLRALFSELLAVNTSLQTVGGTQFPMGTNWWYWSSTERNQSFMWYVTNAGNVSYNLKDYTARVRVIRSF